MNEQHEPKAKGWWIPEQVCDAFDRGNINCTSVILLAHIDSLANAKLGCIASNEYLANKIKLSEFQTRQIIQELIKLGLVVRVSFNGRVRELSTPWTTLKLNEQHADSSKTNSETVEKATVSLLKKQQAKSPILRAKKQPLLDKLNKQEKKTNSPAAALRASGTGVFVKSSLNEVNPQKTIYQVWAELLFNELEKRHKICGKVNLRNWTNTFRKLSTQLGVDNGRIEKVLEWYLPNIGKQYVPKAYSAEGFADKFIQIEDQMNEDPSIKKEVELSEDLDKLHEYLMEKYKWPNGSDSAVSFVLQKSWENYQAFVSKYKQWNPDSENMQLIDTTLSESELIQKPKLFLRDWFKWVNEQIIGWKDWSGRLENYIWNLDHKLYTQRVLRLLSDNDISSKDWEAFKKNLK